MYYLILVAAVALYVSACIVTKTTPQPRRVIWRDTDARARQRIADQWTPIMRAEGAWDVKRGEVEK